MRVLYVAGLVAGLATQPTIAETINYEYVGQPIFISDTDTPSDVFPDGLSGTLSIDTDLFPGGVLANATLRLEYNDDTGLASYEITSGSARFSAAANLSEVDRIYNFIDFSGVIDQTLFGVIFGAASYELVFNDDFDIVDWEGNGGLQGGSNDFFSTPAGDFTAEPGESAGPGAWNRLSAPTPIPLPGGFGLLLGGLGVLGAMRLRKNRRR